MRLYFQGKNFRDTVAERERRWHPPGTKPEPGWVIFWGERHVGIVAAVDIEGGKIEVIEAMGGRGDRNNPQENIMRVIYPLIRQGNKWKVGERFGVGVSGFGEIIR